MMKIAKEWAISRPSYLCWELHICSTDQNLLLNAKKLNNLYRSSEQWTLGKQISDPLADGQGKKLYIVL